MLAWPDPGTTHIDFFSKGTMQSVNAYANMLTEHMRYSCVKCFNELEIRGFGAHFFCKAVVTVYCRCIVCVFAFFHAGVLKKVRDDMEVTAAEDKAATDLVLQSTEVIHIPYLITSGANTIKKFFFIAP